MHAWGHMVAAATAIHVMNSEDAPPPECRPIEGEAWDLKAPDHVILFNLVGNPMFTPFLDNSTVRPPVSSVPGDSDLMWCG